MSLNDLELLSAHYPGNPKVLLECLVYKPCHRYLGPSQCQKHVLKVQRGREECERCVCM